MSHKKLHFLALCLVIPLATGCVAAAVVAAVGVTVHALGEDSFEIKMKGQTADQAYETSLAVLEEMGRATMRNASGHTLEGEVGSSKVTIAVQGIGDSDSRAVVKARKNLGVSPDATTANMVANRIQEKVQSGK